MAFITGLEVSRGGGRTAREAVQLRGTHTLRRRKHANGHFRGLEVPIRMFSALGCDDDAGRHLASIETMKQAVSRLVRIRRVQRSLGSVEGTEGVEGQARTFDLAYVRSGPRASTPVVVVPGGPGMASVLPYAGLRRTARRRGLDILMVEHRGVAFSRTDSAGQDLPPGSMRVTEAVDDLAAVLDTEGIERAVIYGSSYGSYLAGGFGVRHPDRVAGMVLDSPITSAADPVLERDHLRSVLWEGATPGHGDLAAAIRQLAATGVPEPELLVVVRAAYELGGPSLAYALVRARLRGRGRPTWRLLHTYADREDAAGHPQRFFYEFDLVATLAFRELNYAPPIDGQPLDTALVYAKAARAYPGFSNEPFDLRSAYPDFDWPTVVLSGRHDLRTPTPVALEVARLLPRSALVEMDQGHSLLDSHPRAAVEVMRNLPDGRWEDLPARAPELDALSARGLTAALPRLARLGLPRHV